MMKNALKKSSNMFLECYLFWAFIGSIWEEPRIKTDHWNH